MGTPTESVDDPEPTPTAFDLSLRHVLGLAGLLAVAGVPVVAAVSPVGIITDLTVLQVTGALFFAVYVMTWDVVSGYTGEISFGHALFVGVGAYTSGIINIETGLPLAVTIPLGVLAAAVAGLLIGFPSLRVRGPYFSLITLVAPIILARMFVFFSEYTGGETGLFGIDTLTLDPVVHYYIAFGLFVFALAVFLAVTRSDAGEVLTAIRENEEAVVSVGLNPARYKLFVFVLSGAVGGLAGALFVHTFAQGVATPSDTLGLVLSIEIIIAAIVGGIGTITGAAIGGLFFSLVQTWLGNTGVVIPLLEAPVSEFDFLIFGIVTLLFLFFLPIGIVPAISRAVGRARGGAAARTDGGHPPGSRLERARDRLRDLLGGVRR